MRVKVHDFKDPMLGKAVPYGVYDLGRNHGWVGVGIDHDTAAFAVAAIRAWWYGDGVERIAILERAFFRLAQRQVDDVARRVELDEVLGRLQYTVRLAEAQLT